MTYVVDDKCILCKHKDCVEVCPVDCFYEGENTLVINPDECIDCGVCEPECPIGAIVSDTVDIENKDKWLMDKPKWLNNKDFEPLGLDEQAESNEIITDEKVEVQVELVDF